MQKYQIPNFIKWRNEEFCRNTGVVGYERIESCVTQKAKKESHQYVQTAKYAKYDTKEEMEVTFSSNFTDNKVIKIVYRSQAANVTGNSPKATDQVRCHYEGKLIDGTVFDSSYKRGEPAVFGLNQVIAGWTEGVQLMKEGGKHRLYIPYLLGYGERGAGSSIPPYSTLVFDIELLNVL